MLMLLLQWDAHLDASQVAVAFHDTLPPSLSHSLRFPFLTLFFFLQLQHHFHYMWQAGHAQHATPSYDALRALLSRSPAMWHNVDQLPPEEAYMLGATALDCSIMLTFQEIRCQSSRHNR